jgi:hypothetical protein
MAGNFRRADDTPNISTRKIGIRAAVTTEQGA